MSEEDIQIIDFSTDKAMKKKKKGTKKKAKTGKDINNSSEFHCRPSCR